MTESLEELREQVDQYNRGLIREVGGRLEVTRKIGEFKAANGLPPVDLEREAEVMARIAEQSVEAGVPPELMQGILRVIIDHVVGEHEAAKSAILESNKGGGYE